MSQPQWITPAGSLGTIPENSFYSVPVEAVANGANVFYTLIAGQTPDGIEVTVDGKVEGVATGNVLIGGVPVPTDRDFESRFAVRAYTTRQVNGQTVVDRLADRTFTITVTGQRLPEFITPAGQIAVYFDGTEIEYQILFTDPVFEDATLARIVYGELPPGLSMDRSGLISGVISPLVGPPGTALPGWDSTSWDDYAWDFSTRATSQNFQFTVEITNGIDANLRTFEIYVYARDDMTADTTNFTADNIFITADVSPVRPPVLLTPPGDLGVFRADNFFAFKFDAVDFDGDRVQFEALTGSTLLGTLSLPPGLTLNTDTGWLSGYIPDLGTVEYTYRFGVRVYKDGSPDVTSGYDYYTITIIGNIETEITWLTPSNLGVIDNGAISTFYVEAVSAQGVPLEYRLQSGSNSRLPQGLTLLPSGHIVGRVSFNTFALDGGTTTFDVQESQRLGTPPTTFDATDTFTVNAYAPTSEQFFYEIESIRVTSGGSGYNIATPPTVTIAAPPQTENAVQATVGSVTISGDRVVAIEVANPGNGYTSIPTVTISGGGGVGATAVATIKVRTREYLISVLRTFTITVLRRFNEPYEKLYIKAMPGFEDRDIIESFVNDTDIIPESSIYRPDDPNFGRSESVIYDHAYGLTASSLLDYVESLDLNHYWKNITLGEVRTAQARNAAGEVIYEVVYSAIQDDLVNNQGQSVDKEVTLAYPILGPEDSTLVDTVYPNSLINMRDQVIATVGQVSPALPLWMTSKQQNQQILGFTPAWVIAYVKPGEGARIAYNIGQQTTYRLNDIDFNVDRYELDRSQTYNWDPVTKQWTPAPPAATTFDNNTTIFDGGSTTFITPENTWTDTDEYDKYLVFPKRTILG